MGQIENTRDQLMLLLFSNQAALKFSARVGIRQFHRRDAIRHSSLPGKCTVPLPREFSLPASRRDLTLDEEDSPAPLVRQRAHFPVHGGVAAVAAAQEPAGGARERPRGHADHRGPAAPGLFRVVWGLFKFCLGLPGRSRL